MCIRDRKKVEEEKEEEEEQEKAEEQMIKTPPKKADDKDKAPVHTADKRAHELRKANKDNTPAAVDKGGEQSFLGLLQQKQQAASRTHFAHKGQGLAHDAGDDDDGGASSMPAHKKPKVGPTTAVTITKAQPKSMAQPKVQPIAREERQPNKKRARH